MRCRPFDEQISDALRKLGFTISDNGEDAKFTDHESSITIYWPNHPKIYAEDEFELTIELSNGMELNCRTWRGSVLHAAGMDVEDV